jgi:hypothetical protein
VLNRFKDGPLLRGDWQVSLPTGDEEVIHALLFVSRTHDPGMNICTK